MSFLASLQSVTLSKKPDKYVHASTLDAPDHLRESGVRYDRFSFLSTRRLKNGRRPG